MKIPAARGAEAFDTPFGAASVLLNSRAAGPLDMPSGIGPKPGTRNPSGGFKPLGGILVRGSGDIMEANPAPGPCWKLPLRCTDDAAGRSEGIEGNGVVGVIALGCDRDCSGDLIPLSMPGAGGKEPDNRLSSGVRGTVVLFEVIQDCTAPPP